MKHRRPFISPAVIKSDSQIKLEVERRMAMSDAERMHDAKCEPLPACIVCHADGDTIRKTFVPVDCALKLPKHGLNGQKSLAIAICANCLASLLREADNGNGKGERVMTVLNQDELETVLR